MHSDPFVRYHHHEYCSVWSLGPLTMNKKMVSLQIFKWFFPPLMVSGISLTTPVTSLDTKFISFNHLHRKHHVPRCSDSPLFAIEEKSKYRLHTSVMLLFNVLQKYDFIKGAYFSKHCFQKDIHDPILCDTNVDPTSQVSHKYYLLSFQLWYWSVQRWCGLL
jgi:hypothetical protein